MRLRALSFVLLLLEGPSSALASEPPAAAVQRPLAHRSAGWVGSLAVGGAVTTRENGVTPSMDVTVFGGYLYRGAGVGVLASHGTTRHTAAYVGPAALIDGVLAEWRTYLLFAPVAYWDESPLFGGDRRVFGMGGVYELGVHLGETPWVAGARGTYADDWVWLVCDGDVCPDVTHEYRVGLFVAARF